MLCACSSSTVGGGGGGGNFANAPVQPSGVAAAEPNVLDGEFLLVHSQVTPTADPVTHPGAVHIQLKGQLIQKGGTPFSKPTLGRTVRIYEPTLRQYIDRPFQDSSTFDASLEVLPTAFDAGTQKTKGWCWFAVPQGFAGPLADQPTACPLPAPDCFPLDKTWIDFLNENYLDDPCPLPIPVP